MKTDAEHDIPAYTLMDIKLSVGEREFEKGMKLHESGVVQKMRALPGFGYEAVVQGTKPYSVEVAAAAFDRGNCSCYLGENDELCKHMIALAITAVCRYRPDATTIDSTPLDTAVCSGEIRPLADAERHDIKARITAALRHIKPYSGPSRVWFQYQDELTRGIREILLILADLPVCNESADIVINLLQRLDKKLMGGVDDSDGTVGGGMQQIVELLNLFASLDKMVGEHIHRTLPKGEVFDWHEGFGL